MELRMLRINAGLSPEQLGKAVGLSGPTIRELEKGNLPRPTTAKKLADYFDKQPTEIWKDLLDDKATEEIA